MKRVKIQSQPRLQGKCRIPKSAAFEERIARAIRAEARRYSVSESFVQAVAVADAMGIELDPAFRYDGIKR